MIPRTEEKVWLEITIPLGSKWFDDLLDTSRVAWQWRGGRCTKNGLTSGVEEAVEAAWAALVEFSNPEVGSDA